ncbi:MAG: collagen binding domain-containing protein [Vicinamibacterales bacterium]
MVAAALVALTVLSAQAPAPAPAPAGAPDVATATLRGQITDILTGQPVAGARIRAINATGRPIRPICPIDDCNGPERVGPNPTYYAITGADGRYDILDVKPGEYIVTAGGAGYLTRSFGQNDDGAPEGRIDVPPARATTVDITLEQPGTVSGRIVSDAKEGLPGLEVELVRRVYAPGGASYRGVAFVQTEADGVFLFRNVRPGEYYVHAYSPGGHQPTRSGSSYAYTSTYYPDAADLDGGQRVAVSSGQALAGMDFALQVAATHVVTGLLVDAAGPSLAGVRIRFSPMERGGIVDDVFATAAADGSFRAERVLPGRYMVTVQDETAGQRWLGVMQQISVVDDRSVLIIPATPGAHFEGRVVVPEGESSPIPLAQLAVRIDQRVPGVTGDFAAAGDIEADGRFSFEGRVGESMVAFTRLPPGWHVRSVHVDGVEMTDRVFDVLPTDRRRIDIVISGRGGVLGGVTTDDDAKPVPQALVVLFPDDWTRLSRTRLVRTAFSVQGGRFEIPEVAPGSYRAAAVRWLPRDAWNDGDVLARLWSSSESIRIGADEPATLQLLVTEPPEDLFR